MLVGVEMVGVDVVTLMVGIGGVGVLVNIRGGGGGGDSRCRCQWRCTHQCSLLTGIHGVVALAL